MSIQPQEDPRDDGEWYCTFSMGIDEVRLLYSTICYAFETWPGAPKRPYEEQEYLRFMKTRLYAMMCEHSLTEIPSHEKEVDEP
jgi:hypothetical protein|tara:strand:+ start:329 stop:580 length:252 start_codon:yes stop_codon:yes gene_type:complete